MTKRLPCPPAPGPLEAYAAQFDPLFGSLAQRQQLLGMPRAEVGRIQLPNGAQAILRDQHPVHARRLKDVRSFR